jgi:hypothetical protein
LVQGLTQTRSCFLALKIISFALVGRPIAPDVLEDKLQSCHTGVTAGVWIRPTILLVFSATFPRPISRLTPARLLADRSLTAAAGAAAPRAQRERHQQQPRAGAAVAAGAAAGSDDNDSAETPGAGAVAGGVAGGGGVGPRSRGPKVGGWRQ